MDRSELPAWQQVKTVAEALRGVHLSRLFADDNSRFATFTGRLPGLLVDFSKQRITANAMRALLDLARACELETARSALFAGDKINVTEARAAMHWRLRLPVAHADVEVAAQLERMEQLVMRIQAGQWRGAEGDAITDVVNIGVGGSDLGPRMVVHALQELTRKDGAPLRVHFVSSMDGSQIGPLQQRLNPGSTLFIISSKSFGTPDTLHNASTARQWLVSHLGDEEAVLRCHFIGTSAKPAAMSAWGIPTANQLLLWDWVGGRFSLWSTIGLPIALAIGMPAFRELLAGAHAVDEHFRTRELSENLPVLLALLEIWNVNFLGIKARTLLPYDGRLRYLPAYLEQLEMESNGKSVSTAGATLAHDTCPVIWGEVGPDAQHAFYQLLHQGTQAVACDFIVPAKRRPAEDTAKEELQRQHELALANCLAQSRLLAFGDAALAQVAQEPWRRYRGNQPSNLLLLDELTPFTLGSLLALYEHKVFVAATLWQINPFDQWGVEMGKKLATSLLPQVAGTQLPAAELDASTLGVLATIRAAHAK